jgi:hypothetical protein
MSDNLHTSLPIEYQLKYGTAPNFVGSTASNGVDGIYGTFRKKNCSASSGSIPARSL